jgi:predicted Zn-dependent peptidase
MAKKTRKSLKIPSRDIERTVLDNGVRVISERVKGSPAAMTSLWVDSGARYENLNESGATHLIQRLALHGAGGRSADRIAKEIGRLGGEFEAQTERDSAVYQMRVSPDDISAGTKLITDIALRPSLTQAALTAESEKLLEELRALDKDADLVLERMFLRSLWKGHGLCREPRGRLLTVRGQTKLEAFKPNKLKSFHTHSHHPNALTFVAAGNVRHDAIEKLAGRLLGSLEHPKSTASTITPKTYKFLALRNRPQFSKVRVEIGFPTCAAADKERHSAALLNAVIGGGPDSRLALSASKGKLPTLAVSSQLRMFSDVGCLSIRTRSDRQNAEKVIQRIGDELWRIADKHVDENEIERARTVCKAALLSEVDSLSNRVAGLASAERYHKRLLSLKEEFEALDQVTAKAVLQLASLWINPYELSMAVLGNLAGLKIGRRMLERH